MNPGDHARGWLGEMGPAPKGGGQCDGVPGNQLLALLAGRRAVRAATATRVGAATGTSAAIWRPGPGPSPQFRAWPLVVHPLNQCEIWDGRDPETAGRTMAAAASPD